MIECVATFAAAAAFAALSALVVLSSRSVSVVVAVAEIEPDVVVRGPIGAVPADTIDGVRAGTSARGPTAPGTLAAGVAPSGAVPAVALAPSGRPSTMAPGVPVPPPAAESRAEVVGSVVVPVLGMTVAEVDVPEVRLVVIVVLVLVPELTGEIVVLTLRVSVVLTGLMLPTALRLLEMLLPVAVEPVVEESLLVSVVPVAAVLLPAAVVDPLVLPLVWANACKSRAPLQIPAKIHRAFVFMAWVAKVIDRGEFTLPAGCGGQSASRKIDRPEAVR